MTFGKRHTGLSASLVLFCSQSVVGVQRALVPGPDALPGYVWDQHKISPDPANDAGFPERIAKIIAGVDRGSNMGCPDWNGYFWPAASWIAGQMWKRAQAANRSDPAQQTQLDLLLNQTAYLMCLPKFDPRKGTHWSEAVQDYMKKLPTSPGIPLPPLPHEPFFAKHANQSLADMVVFDGCAMWAKNMACDVAWWGQHLRGNKVPPDELCWDKVEWAGYGFTVAGGVNMFGRGAPKVDDRQRIHPEYSECLEKPLDDDVFDQLCPEGGHLADGAFDIQYWGDGVRDHEGQKEIIQCSAQMGIPTKRGFHTLPSFPWSPVINLW